MNKMSINHIKGICKCNNNDYYTGAYLNLRMILNIQEIERNNLKLGVKNYNICFLGNIDKIYIYHRSNKKHCFSRRKQISL